MCSFEGCAAAFALKHHLSRHEKLHSNPKPFGCEWPGCLAAFSKHDQLKTHVAVEHTGEAVHKCPKCAEEFESKAEMKRHDKSKHLGRTYMCGFDGCGESFTKWSAVVAHRKSSHLKQPKSKTLTPSTSTNIFLELYCEECGKGPFKTESSHRQHCKIHSKVPEIPKHACPHCENSKTFASRSSLKAHLLAVHSSEMPFACHLCDKAYGYKKLLKKHFEKAHVNHQSADTENSDNSVKSLLFFKERSLLCPVKGCNRHFFRSYDLIRHTQSMHKF